MNSFFDQIVPGILAAKSNKIIDKSYNNATAKKVVPLPSNSKISENLAQLKGDVEKQRERKKGIEDKAKTIFTTISISVTAITFILNYNNLNFNTPLSLISLTFLLLSIAYFIMASIRAMQTINIRAFHVFQVEMKEIDNEIILEEIGEEQTQVQNLAKIKYLNDNIILKISNYGWASFVLVRNGIILFAAYFAIALFQKANIGGLNTNKSITITINDSSSKSLHTIYATFEKDENSNSCIKIDSIRNGPKNKRDTTRNGKH